MAIQKQKLAADILEYVGGVDNVRDVAHCMTRLRIVVKDEKAVQMKQLEKLEGVMKVVILGGQYQIVLGGIVDDIFDEVAAVCGDRVNINEEMIAENLDAETKREDVLFSVCWWKRFQLLLHRSSRRCLPVDL